MTKREICERLLAIHNRLFHEYAMADGMEDIDVEEIGKDIGSLILDLAAPEEEKPKAEVPIPETPLLWVDGNAPLSPCPKCGANCPKLDERTSGLPGAYHYCQSCHAYFMPKNEEPDDHIADAGKMVREEPPHGVIAKPGKDGGIEWCWCQKCYGAADVVHDPFGDGENWSYCKTCGVSFRLKRAEEGK